VWASVLAARESWFCVNKSDLAIRMACSTRSFSREHLTE
jgi:hypothetical protein